MLTENAQKWTSIITESLHIENPSKVNWMAQYAANHEMYEALQSNPDVAGGIYSTPLNTLGMGNPMMPQGVGYNNGGHGTGVGNTGADFHNPNYQVGSGDIPMSTLTMSLEIAAMTIGFELVPVIPASGPWAMLSYMDFPYAGGKLGKLNETVYDGKGPDAENKPIYIKLRYNVVYATGKNKNDLVQGNDMMFVAQTIQAAGTPHAGAYLTFNGTFIGFSRIDNSIIVKVVDCGSSTQADGQGTYTKADDVSIADVFGKNVILYSTAASSVLGTQTSQAVTPDLVSGMADHVQGFSNFYDGDKEPMTRAQNETGVGNTIGARMFTKLVQMGSFEVTGSVTRQQLQDMPLYGVDVVGKVLEAMQNEISQSINNRILDRVFKLGVENAKVQREYQNVDLNLFFGATATPDKLLSSFGAAQKMVDLNNVSAADTTGWAKNWTVKNATQNTAAENTHTHQRRIMSRCLAAANLIANVSRFGRGQWVVTNTQVLSALQDCAGFVVAPMTNTLTQDGSNSLYFAGSIAGLQVYVDPYMTWDDTRICVGRKSDGNTPGVIFMPYILADTVQTIVEGTMAPKLLVNSRFAIVDAGFHPDQNYFTFMVDAEGAYFL